MADPKKILEINGQHSDLDNNQSGIKDDGNRAWIHKTLEGDEIESAVKGDVTRQNTFDAGNIVKTDTTDFTVSGDSYYQSANHYLKVAVESGATFDLLFKTDDGKVQFDVKTLSLSSSGNASLLSGGSLSLKDFYLSSAITLSETGQTALATTSQSIVGAINEVKASVTLQGAYDAGNTIDLSTDTGKDLFVGNVNGSEKGLSVQAEDTTGGEDWPEVYIKAHADIVSFEDQYLDSPVPLSESGQSALATDSQSLVGSINEVLRTNKFNGFDLQVPASIPELAFDDTTRVFTASIKSGSSDFYFWCSGLKFSKTSSESVTIPDVTGTYYTYFDNSGTLQYVNQDSVTAPLLYEYAIVGLIYWNATAQESEVGNECHGIRMSSATHDFEHHTYGARYQSGFDIEGLSAGNDTYTHVTSGGFRDEDILHMVDAIASAPFIYRLGTTGEWWRTLPDLNIGHNAGGTYDVWNEDTGTTWQLTEGTNSTDYFITFLIEKPSITGSNLNKIISQGTYSSANRARGAIESEQSKLVLNGLPSPEFVFIGAIIVNRNGELQLLSDGSLYYDLRVQKGGSGAVGSSGEANTTSNAGTGVGIALSKVGTDLPLASLTSTGGTVGISLDGENLNLETIGSSSNATSIRGIEVLDTMPAGALANLYFLIVMWYQNLITYSQDISQWGLFRVATPTLSGTITPDGIPYWNIISSVDLNNHRVSQTYTALSTVTTVVSCIKNGATNGWVLLNKSGVSTYLNLATGAIGSDTATDTQVEACGTGWKVYWQVVDVIGATSFNVYPAESDGDFTFAGDGTSVDLELTQVHVIDGDIAHAKTLPYAPTTSIADAGTQKYTPTLITDLTGA